MRFSGASTTCVSGCAGARARALAQLRLRGDVLVLSCLVAASCAHPSTAWGDVRKADEIMGTTMEQRSLSAARCPSIDAEYAFVVDGEGVVYFARNAQAAAQIASITKVMTALVALEAAPLDTTVTVSEYAAEVGESSAHLQAGDVMTLEVALKALMIPSGNDAAIAIAHSVGAVMLGQSFAAADEDEAIAAFVAAMNEKAAELGCVESVFENPHGLDDGTFAGSLHSCAADVAKIVAAAMQDDTFRSIVATEAATIEVQREGKVERIELESTDEMLGEYEGACGVKTGYTDLAGACFAGASNRGEGDLYAIVLDSSSEAQRFVDAETLFNWVYDNRVSYPLAHSDQTATMTINGTAREVPVVAEVAQSCWTDKTLRATFADPDASVEVFALNGNVSQEFEFYELSGEVSQGDVVGVARFYQRNELVASVELVSCENSPAPGVLESIGIWWQRVVSNFTGQSACAESVVVNATPLIYDKQS